MFIAFDISVSKWLAFAFAMMLDKPVYALIIVVATTLLLGFLVGRLWGKAWNKEWNLGGARFWGIGFLSLFAGLCLGGGKQHVWRRAVQYQGRCGYEAH